MNIGKETEFIEFKRSTSETKEGVISISSILNKHQHGTIYFGVKDNGDVTGQEIGRDTERKLSKDISDAIKPPMFYEVQTKHADDGKRFIEVSFHGTNSPYSAYGKYYQRFADEDRQISDSELERLFRARQKDYSEWENADSTERVSGVDEGLLKRVVDDGNESGRIKYRYTDAPSILSKLGLYNASTGFLTNAGRVLFSANHPVLLKTAIYATETKETFVKLNHFEGNVFECINEGIAFIMSAINWNVVIGEGPKRDENPEIPQAAIREMVLNAFAHGCYYANTSFAIEVFSDRVMIYNPGFFPVGYTPEEFANNAAEPIMMNPKIVNVLFKASVIESFGTGYERTFAACKKASVGYEYENTKTGFRFVFFRGARRNAVQDNVQDNVQDSVQDSVQEHGTGNADFNRDAGTYVQDNVQDSVQDSVQDNVQDIAVDLPRSGLEVYGFLRECDSLTITELARRIGKSEKTVSRAIKLLKDAGYIEREGNDSKGRWKILK